MFLASRQVLVAIAVFGLALPAWGQDAKKEKEKPIAPAESPVDKALELAKSTGLPILAVGGRET